MNVKYLIERLNIFCLKALRWGIFCQEMKTRCEILFQFSRKIHTRLRDSKGRQGKVDEKIANYS